MGSNMSFIIGVTFGAFVWIFLFSRLALWLTKKFKDKKYYLLTIHAIVIVISTLLLGIANADSAGPKFLEAFMSYLPASIAWTFYDLWQFERKKNG